MFVAMQNISKQFGGQRVLDGVEFSAPEGSFTTLLGPSGCGKTTLLRILAGIVELDGGNILIGGRNITHLDSRLREIGMVFQSYALFPNLTVRQNIAFGLEMQKQHKATIAAKVDQMLALVQLEGKEDSYPRELSGGQQQRVALARSLVTQPKVLLLDEPLSALDAKIRKKLRIQLRDIQKELGITTVMVTHDQEEAMVISDYVHVMSQGRIVQSGTPREVYTQPNSLFVANFIGNYNILSADILHQVAPQFIDFGAPQYAIRPETLQERGFSGCIELTATVTDIVMMGNVVQFELEAAGQRLCCHRLHRHFEMDFAVGQKKVLFVDPLDIVPIQEDSESVNHESMYSDKKAG